MAERRRGLGRGLGALIPSAPADPPEDTQATALAGEAPQTEAPKDGVSRETPRSVREAEAVSNDASTEHNAATQSSRSGATTEAPSEDAEALPESSASSTKKTSGSAPKKSKRKSGAGNTAPENQTSTVSETQAQMSADDVSRETPKPKRRAVSAEARQKAMKARMDLGVSSRSTTTNRPSDMFFTPGSTDDAGMQEPPEAESEISPSDGLESPPAAEVTGPVSRETADQSDVSEPSVAANSHHVANDRVSNDAAAGGAESANSDDLKLVPGARFAELSVEDIHPNRKQPRQVFDEDELAELAYSIGELGVLQPVVVRVSREADGPQYELVMGERRWRATQRAGLESIPAIVRETSDDDLLRDALLENLHRSQLNPLEEAAAYQQLLDEFGASQEELSRRIGRSRPQISNTLRLLRLPALVQRRVAAGVLSAGHARALLSLEDPAEMERLAQRIVAEGLSVRATEEAVTLNKSRKPTVRRSAATQERHRARLDYIADAFSDKLDTSVKINLGARKGRMMIEFASVEDLNRIISVLDPQGLPENQN